MLLITCLGNPGSDYTHTRHNIGFRIGDALLNMLPFEKLGSKFKSIAYEATINNRKILLLFPQTYMNLSGEAVWRAMSFYKIPPEQLIVVYDDYDIEFGSIRFRESGSGGSHNGMKSIISEIGSKNFYRMRVGIGPKPPEWDTSSFVLAKFTQREEDVIPDILNHGANVLSTFITEGKDSAMRLCHKN